MSKQDDCAVLLVGARDERVISSAETQQQIDEACSLDYTLFDGGLDAGWIREECEMILEDRALRVDRNIMMASRPPLFVIHYDSARRVRHVETYTGHDRLERTLGYSSIADGGPDCQIKARFGDA